MYMCILASAVLLTLSPIELASRAVTISTQFKLVSSDTCWELISLASRRPTVLVSLKMIIRDFFQIKM